MTIPETLAAARRTVASITRNPLPLGDVVLPHAYAMSWEREAEHRERNRLIWHGRIEAVFNGDHWRVYVLWIDDAHGGQISGQYDHADPSIALANALERLELPSDFLAAMRRPV